MSRRLRTPAQWSEAAELVAAAFPTGTDPDLDEKWVVMNSTATSSVNRIFRSAEDAEKYRQDSALTDHFVYGPFRMALSSEAQWIDDRGRPHGAALVFEENGELTLKMRNASGTTGRLKFVIVAD